MPTAIQEPNTSELDWIQDNLRMAHGLVALYLRVEVKPPIDPESLDLAYRAWFTLSKEKEDPNQTINAFGIAFGQYIVETLEMKWAVVTDENGTEMGVHGQPGDILMYPPNLVGKRFARRETDFFQPIYADLEKRVARLRGQGEKKAWWRFGR